MEEGVHLTLKAVQSVEEEEHAQLKAKTKPVPLVFPLSVASLVYAMMILNMSMHTTGTPGGGGEHVKLLHKYNFPSYPNIILIA